MPINMSNCRLTGDTKNTLFTSAGGASFEDQLTNCAEQVLRTNKPLRIPVLNRATKSSSKQRYHIQELKFGPRNDLSPSAEETPFVI